MTIASNDERFQHGAQDYAAYLQSPEGRWRADLAFANLQDFLPIPQASRPRCALDVGCGTGATALSLTRLGFHVTLLDSSQTMLDLARRAASSAGITDRVAFQLGDAARLTALLPGLFFDVVLCHNLLEYVDDPASVLRAAARACATIRRYYPSLCATRQARSLRLRSGQAIWLPPKRISPLNGDANLSTAAPCGSLRRPG